MVLESWGFGAAARRGVAAEQPVGRPVAVIAPAPPRAHQQDLENAARVPGGEIRCLALESRRRHRRQAQACSIIIYNTDLFFNINHI